MLKLDTSKEGKKKRYIEVFDRLRADHYLRYGLLDRYEELDQDATMYFEANETISDDENKLWDYIEGIVDTY